MCTDAATVLNLLRYNTIDTITATPIIRSTAKTLDTDAAIVDTDAAIVDTDAAVVATVSSPVEYQQVSVQLINACLFL